MTTMKDYLDLCIAEGVRTAKQRKSKNGNNSMKNITTFKNGARVDNEGVARFTKAMRLKLAKKRREGRGGWQTPQCVDGKLWEMMINHVKKGDVVDVATLAMMIWNKRNPI